MSNPRGFSRQWAEADEIRDAQGRVLKSKVLPAENDADWSTARAIFRPMMPEGLEISVKADGVWDGVWLTFRARGMVASLCVETFVERNHCGTIVGRTVLDWCAEYRKSMEPPPPFYAERAPDGSNWPNGSWLICKRDGKDSADDLIVAVCQFGTDAERQERAAHIAALLNKEAAS